MADQQLVQYLREWISKGYSFEQLKQYLVQYGYNERDITIAYNSLYRRPSPFSWLGKKEEKYPLPGMNKEQIQEVHPLPEQRQRRVLYPTRQQQYQQYRPQQYQQPQQQPEEKHHIHITLSKNTAIIAASVLVFVVFASLLSYLVFFKTQIETPSQLLDVISNPTQNSIERGEKLIVTTSIRNLGQQKRFDVIVSYTLTHIRTGKVIYDTEDTVAVETVKDHVQEIMIDDSAPLGEYTLATTVTYEKLKIKATAKDRIKVFEKSATASCFDNIKNQNEEEVDCGGVCGSCVDTCTNNVKDSNEEGIDCGGVCLTECKKEEKPAVVEATCFDSIKNQDETGVDCGGVCRQCTTLPKEQLSPRQILLRIRTIAHEDENLAVQYCDSIPQEFQKDSCYNSIADELKGKKYCDLITSQSLKESCSLPFVLGNKEGNCDDLTGTLQSTCMMMKNAQRYAKAVQENKTPEEMIQIMNLSLRIVKLPLFSEKGYNLTANVNVAYEYTFKATSQYGNKITYAVDSPDITIDSETGKISFTPTEKKAYSFTVSANDGNGTGKAKVRLIAQGENTAPVAEPIGEQYATIGQEFTYQVMASDPDFDTITYTDNTPLFDIDAKTGLIIFIPTAEMAGTYDIKITASDPKGASEDKTMRLNIGYEQNNPPEFTNIMDSIDAVVGTPYMFDVNAIDPEGNAIEYSTDSVLLRQYLNPNTGQITAVFMQPVDDTVPITASDGVKSTTVIVPIHVSVP